MRPLPTAEQVRALLDYDPATGVFRWKRQAAATKDEKIWNAKYAGKVAGTPLHLSGGYIQIRVKGKSVRAHRLAWLCVYGEWPDIEIDHRNGDTKDNRICNLRLSTSTQNKANSKLRSDNTVGLKGVSFDRARGKFRAQININGRVTKLGRFETAEEAHSVYAAAAERHFGEFARLS